MKGGDDRERSFRVDELCGRFSHLVSFLPSGIPAFEAVVKESPNKRCYEDENTRFQT